MKAVTKAELKAAEKATKLAVSLVLLMEGCWAEM